MEALLQIQADNKAAAMASTWGHLAPKKRKYFGSIWVVRTHYNNQNLEIVNTDFEGLPNSPWECMGLFDIIFEYEKSANLEEKKIYKITGWIEWGEIIPEDFDLDEWKEGWAEDETAKPTFPEGFTDWELTHSIEFSI